MSDNTKILDLPLIQGGQAQKHITHNEAIRRLDALVQAVALDSDRTEPPALPDEGDRHLIAAAAQGDWLGRDGMLAVREGDAWAYIVPADGWQVHVLALGTVLTYDGGGWVRPSTTTAGINASADETNRLTVSADATLLTHDGAGHQVKINKATPGDTNSLLFQTGYSGRAEMGCAGSDSFSVKVSPDGGTWNSALETDPATGKISFPSGARVPREIQFGGRWYCYDDNRWVTFHRLAGIETDTNNAASGTAANPDMSWQTMGPLVKAGSVLTGVRGFLRASSDEITGYDVRIGFKTGPLDGTWSNDTQTLATPLAADDGVPITQAWSRFGMPFTPFEAPSDGFLTVYFRPIGTLSSLEMLYSALTLDFVS